MRAVVVGTGYAAAQHVDALRRLGDVEIAALVGRDEEGARAAAGRLALDGWTSDLASVLADQRIDVVHVCTPNDLHLPLAAAALRAGKHVLCEKPLALDVAGGEELVAMASATDRLALVCHNYRFFPQLQELASRLRSGELGRPHLVRGWFLQDWLLSPVATDWRVDPLRIGASRAMADIGTHWTDAVETVSGQRVVAVQAQIASLHDARPTEDQASLLLAFDGGSQGALVVSQVAPGHRNDVEIAFDCSVASAVWHSGAPHELRIGRTGGVETVTGAPVASNESRRRMIAAAYAAVRGADPGIGLPTFADGLHQLRIVAAALESARAGGRVAVMS